MLKLILAAFCFHILLTIYVTFFHQPQNVNSKSLVNYDGIGSIKIGMTVERAEEVSFLQLLPITSTGLINKGCYYVEPESGFGLNYVRFLIVKEKIAAIEVNRNRNLATVAGARVGQNLSQVKSIYGTNLTSVTDKENQVIKLVYTPIKNKNNRIIFEIDSSTISSYRAGKLPEVNFSNGCFDYKN